MVAAADRTLLTARATFVRGQVEPTVQALLRAQTELTTLQTNLWTFDTYDLVETRRRLAQLETPLADFDQHLAQMRTLNTQLGGFLGHEAIVAGTANQITDTLSNPLNVPDPANVVPADSLYARLLGATDARRAYAAILTTGKARLEELEIAAATANANAAQNLAAAQLATAQAQQLAGAAGAGAAAGLLNRANRPKLEVPMFSGTNKTDPWEEWWPQYDAIIHQDATFNEIEKLTSLRNHLLPPAKGIISAQPISAAGYNTSIDLLTRRYGNPVQLVEKTQRKIRDLKIVDTLKGVREFLDKLNGFCQRLVNLGGNPNESSLLTIVIEKLPPEWRQKVITRREAQGIAPANWNMERFRTP